jgi:ribonuclease HI
MKNKIKIFCDGGARGNPGPAAAAFVVETGGQEYYSQAFYLGKATNNIAEYAAVWEALSWLVAKKELANQEIFFVLDSELVVKQINGLYKVKNQNLKKYFSLIKILLEKFSGKISFQNVSREKNKKADFLVNEKLDSVL